MMDHHNSKFSRFLSGKGFYVALAVCLIGTAAATWIAVDSAQLSLIPSESVSSSSSSASRSSSSSRLSSSSSSAAAVGGEVSGLAVSSSTATASVSQSIQPPAPVTAPADQTVSSVPEETPVQSNQEDVSVEEDTPLFPTQQPLVFVVPIEGEVFGVFSQGELVRNVTLGEWRTHDGIDIKAAQGAPVRAAADGVVSRVYDDPMWGTVVEITHAGGLTSITSGLDPSTAVSQGDSVRAADTIGVVGTILAEISMDSHIHFAMKQDGVWVDPIVAMGKNPV